MPSRRMPAEMVRCTFPQARRTCVVNNKELSTKNVEVGATIAPPTTDGEGMVSTVIESDSQKIRLQKGQVYILTINGRTLKFAL